MTRLSSSTPPRLGTRGDVARDTLTILVFALLAVAVAQLTGLSTPGTAQASPTAGDTGIITGDASDQPLLTMAPLDTIGPIVNPSAALDATPTPIPIITLAPPTPTPPPTPKPSHRPTPAPSRSPKPTPSITPSPSPTLSTPP